MNKRWKRTEDRLKLTHRKQKIRRKRKKELARTTKRRKSNKSLLPVIAHIVWQTSLINQQRDNGHLPLICKLEYIYQPTKLILLSS